MYLSCVHTKSFINNLNKAGVQIKLLFLILQQQEEKRNKLNLYILHLGTLKKRDEEETGCYNDFSGIKRVSLLLSLSLLHHIFFIPLY